MPAGGKEVREDSVRLLYFSIFDIIVYYLFDNTISQYIRRYTIHHFLSCLTNSIAHNISLINVTAFTIAFISPSPTGIKADPLETKWFYSKGYFVVFDRSVAIDG